eukprot:232484-Chlamydomonas_euryale.AAC.4
MAAFYSPHPPTHPTHPQAQSVLPFLAVVGVAVPTSAQLVVKDTDHPSHSMPPTPAGSERAALPRRRRRRRAHQRAVGHQGLRPARRLHPRHLARICRRAHCMLPRLPLLPAGNAPRDGRGGRGGADGRAGRGGKGVGCGDGRVVVTLPEMEEDDEA